MPTLRRGLTYSCTGLRGPQSGKLSSTSFFFSQYLYESLIPGRSSLLTKTPSHSHTARKNGNTERLLTKRVAMRTQQPWYVTTCSKGYGLSNPKHYVLYRLTSAGLALLLTQMSKKPKNPV